MYKTTSKLLLALVLGLTVAVTSCGGGDGGTTTPTPPNPGDQNPGGDNQEPQLPGQTSGNFTLPGNQPFGDLRGVAASQNFVYVADTTRTYCFTKLGQYLRSVASPQGATIEGIAVFPPPPQIAGLDYSDYFLADHPVIVHSPVRRYGYITIYGPTLDYLTDIPDANAPDAAKYIALPHGEDIDPPGVVPPPPGPPFCLRTFDIKVDRFGSILVTADVDEDGADPASYPSSLQILNFFNDFHIETHGTFNDPNDPTNPRNGSGIPAFWPGQGDAVGFLATMATDTYYPTNRTELTYNFYTGDTNLQRDYVGVSQITFDATAVVPSYSLSALLPDDFGYSRIIGSTYGATPGAFALDAPVNPNTGDFEDPDVVAGGPSYMNVDKATDNLWVCDPGNRRVQEFDGETGAYITQLGDGLRGNAGNHFLCPTHIETDLEGNSFVCDVNDLRVFRPSPADRAYGNVGGTVHDLLNGNVLQGASVTIGSDLGTLGSVTTDINGQYLINNLLTGTYYMTATKFNYGSDNTPVQILPDTTVVANFNLRPVSPATLGAYSGTVVAQATNLPVVGATVRILTTSLQTTTDATGAFVINNVAPGTYQIQFSAPGLSTVTKQVTILAGQVYHEQLVVMPPA
jgi:hypothetical protein